jgi:hypothetical protein
MDGARGVERRRVLGWAGAAGMSLAATGAAGAARARMVALSPPLPGGPDARPLVTDYPTKRAMILQRTRPPLLETPFEVFDDGVGATFPPTWMPESSGWRCGGR